MNAVMAYFERTIYGMTEYFRVDKTLVLLLATLLYLGLKEKKKADNNGNRVLVYSTIVTFLLLFPISAMFAVIYQTAFYDYAWTWSMVPVSAVFAYGVVAFYDDTTRASQKRYGIIIMVMMIFLLFVCGNQGTLQTHKDANASNQAKTIAMQTLQNKEDTPVIMWAPQNIMQATRRHTGEIALIYGKDMWDEKAGAYDYEVYSEAYVEAYEWMELLDLIATETDGEGNFAVLREEYKLEEGAYQNSSMMIEHGVNVIVIPRMAAGMFEEVLELVLEEKTMTMQQVYMEQYVLYLLK